jgi:hypothetical protein
MEAALGIFRELGDPWVWYKMVRIRRNFRLKGFQD